MKPRWSSRYRDALIALDGIEHPSPAQRVIGAASARADRYAAHLAFFAFGERAAATEGRLVAQRAGINMVLLKPVGDACNLGCRYCYEAERRVGRQPPAMSIAAMRAILGNLIPGCGPRVVIAVHGGEPLLASREFFHELVGEVRTHQKTREIKLGVQTNGTLIDREWAAFFAENEIEVGLSLDGPAAVHDAARVDKRGQGTSAAVLGAIRLLRDAGLNPGVISVLTSAQAQRRGSAHEHFQEFMKLGIRSFDVHPAFSPAEGVRDFNVSPDDYARFMIELFESWLAHGEPDVSISSFDHVFQGMNGVPGNACYRAGACTSIVGVEPNGDVNPCTRPFVERFKFGNLQHEPLADIISGPSFARFRALELEGRERTAECPWRELCGAGGCPHERLESGQQAVNGRHVYCTCHSNAEGGFPAIVSHIERRAEALIV
jgi:uncharacterized protein